MAADKRPRANGAAHHRNENGKPTRPATGFDWQRWALARLDLPAVARIVLAQLLSHASDETGVAFPSVTTLADETGLSARSVRRWLAWLVGHGRITRTPRWTPTGFPAPSSYSPIYPCVSPNTGAKNGRTATPEEWPSPCVTPRR
jgi:hypothetical protein